MTRHGKIGTQISVAICKLGSSRFFLHNTTHLTLTLNSKNEGVTSFPEMGEHTTMIMGLTIWLFVATPGYCAVWNQPTESTTTGPRSSVVLPLTGSVYPAGNYHVTLNIGNPPKPYFLDIDSGSDLTWLQCDAPCTKCSPAPHILYKPSKNLVTSMDPLCASFHGPANNECAVPSDQCDYEVEYADQGSSLGVLVRDSFHLSFTNGSVLSPRLTFGCGYNQEFPEFVHPPFTDGVLGLGDGNSSIMAQLHDMGLTRKVLGHCLSGKGGGFLFLGDDIIPSTGVVWIPMMRNPAEKHYMLGPAELLYGEKSTGVKGLRVVFDSGSTYSYFNSKAYKEILSMVKKNLNVKQLKDAPEDKSLPVCWKGSKPFKFIEDVRNYFQPFSLSFTKNKKVQLQLQPEGYLVITEHGNVCLGILNGAEVGLGDFNILGDISFQDKMVIYDSQNQQIGWVDSDCDRLPKLDGDFIKGLSGANHDIFQEKPRNYVAKDEL